MKAKIKIIYIINIVKSSRLQYETKLHVNKTQPFHNTENADVLFFHNPAPTFGHASDPINHYQLLQVTVH